MPDKPMRIEFELFSQDNSSYITWNVAECVKLLRDAPHESSITLMVYQIHRDILSSRGVSEDDLKIGDRYVEEAKTQYLMSVN